MGEGEDGPDMVNRDPNNLNDGLNVRFEDIIGEPDSSHSPDCAWRCGYKCYEGARSICYKIITILCTWLCGFCWGCEFACTTFSYIWICVPTVHLSKLVCGTCQSLYQTCLDCCLAPVCSAAGMYFSNIRVTQG